MLGDERERVAAARERENLIAVRSEHALAAVAARRRLFEDQSKSSAESAI
jgi:hypothetical protein